MLYLWNYSYISDFCKYMYVFENNRVILATRGARLNFVY